jgi:hypothetical protein
MNAVGATSFVDESRRKNRTSYLIKTINLTPMHKLIPLRRHLSLSVMALLISMSTFAEGPNDPDGDPGIDPPSDPGPPPTDPGGGGPPTDPDAEVPFDGGLSLLLAAGTAYGAKKAVDYRKFMKAAKADGKA